MADILHVYFDSGLTNQLSEGTAANPDAISGNGVAGFTSELALYCGVQASPGGFKYDSVTVTEQNDNVTNNLQYASDVSGSPGTYANGPKTLAAAGAYITPGNYVKFWRKLIAASGQSAVHITNMKHRITYTEWAV